jgi:hypothetical protein
VRYWLNVISFSDFGWGEDCSERVFRVSRKVLQEAGSGLLIRGRYLVAGGALDYSTNPFFLISPMKNGSDNMMKPLGPFCKCW